MTVQPIPEGYHSITPYLIIKGAANAIEFYQKAFGATEFMRLDGPGGSVAHAELQIGDSRVMLGDECPEIGDRHSTWRLAQNFLQRVGGLLSGHA